MGYSLRDIPAHIRAGAEAATDRVHVSQVQPDGSQWMVREYPDGTVVLAQRHRPGGLWSAPIELVEES